MMAVAISPAPGTAAGKPQKLFTASFVRSISQMRPAYEVTADGHFLMVKKKEVEPVRHIQIVVNWFEDLKRRVPSKGN